MYNTIQGVGYFVHFSGIHCHFVLINIPCFVIVHDDTRISPRINKVYVGAMARFKCSSYCTASWFVIKETLVQRFLYRGSTLKINRTSLNDAGVYYCYGSNIHGHQHFWARASLKVYGEFTINTDSLKHTVTYLFDVEMTNLACHN